MRFRPFGTKIDLYSPLPRDECRRRLEAKFVKGWGRAGDRRPRGKFVGSMVVMWLGAYDWLNRESEPKLILFLSPDGAGTRLKGRAIPGIQSALFLLPTAIASFWMAVALLAYRPARAPADPLTYLIVKLILASCPIGFVAAIWISAHYSAKSGRPMITWVRNLLSAHDGPQA